MGRILQNLVQSSEGSPASECACDDTVLLAFSAMLADGYGPRHAEHTTGLLPGLVFLEPKPGIVGGLGGNGEGNSFGARASVGALGSPPPS